MVQRSRLQPNGRSNPHRHHFKSNRTRVTISQSSDLFEGRPGMLQITRARQQIDTKKNRREGGHNLAYSICQEPIGIALHRHVSIFSIFFSSCEQKENRRGNLFFKKTKHSSRKLKIVERNYCLTMVPSTTKMKLTWCSLHIINNRNPNDGRGAGNPIESMNKHWKLAL